MSRMGGAAPRASRAVASLSRSGPTNRPEKPRIAAGARHHWALDEPDQRQLRIVKAEPLEFRIEKSVNRPPRLDRAVPAVIAAAWIVWRPIGEGEPLSAHRRARASLRRVWRDERRFGHERAPLAPKLDEVIAVRSIAVQEDHELART